MATFYRADGWVKSVQGQAIAGASIYICTQPADFAFLPPIPLASVFADPLGLTPIVQPLITDGFGHFDYYAASGTPYTEVVVNNGKVQANYQDQVPMGATLGPSLPAFPGDPTMFLNGTGVFSVPAGGGGGSVTSVFGRAGVVVAAVNDYDFSQLSGLLALGQIPAGGSPTTFLRGDGSWATPAGAGTVTNTGVLTLNAIILGNAGVDIKAGVVLPGSAAVFLDGTGAFSTPPVGTGTVTSVAAGTGLTATPSPIVGSGTIALANTAVTPGSYTNTNLTVDQQGRITLAANGTGGGGGASGGPLVFLEEHIASGSTSLDFVTFTSAYDEYVIEVINLLPATDGATLMGQLSTDGGSTWDTTASNYMGGSHYTRMDQVTAGDNSGQTSFAGAYFSSVYANAQPGLSGRIAFFNATAVVYRQFVYQMQGTGAGGGSYYNQTGGAIWKGTTQANALRIKLDNGNITSGTVRLYGVSTTNGSSTTVNNQVANYVAVLGDAENIVTMNVAGANTFTVPPNSSVAFPIGTTLTIIQIGAGQVTLTQGVGVTINTASSLTTRAQWSTVAVIQTTTDVWVAGGDLT